MLLDNGANFNAQSSIHGNALQMASFQGHKEVVEVLLEKGADVIAQSSAANALQAASNRGHKEIVQLLLEKGADVNNQDGHYSTVLQAASFRGHKEIVRLLIEKGADVNARAGICDDSTPNIITSQQWLI